MNQLMTRLDKEWGKRVAEHMKEKGWKGQTFGMKVIEAYFESQDQSNKEVEVKKPRAPAKRFVKPAWEEVASYFHEQGSITCQDDATRFIDFYESNGWKVGKNPMKDWKATVRTWMKRKQDDKQSGSKAISGRDAITFKNTDF